MNLKNPHNEKYESSMIIEILMVSRQVPNYFQALLFCKINALDIFSMVDFFRFFFIANY